MMGSLLFLNVYLCINHAQTIFPMICIYEAAYYNMIIHVIVFVMPRIAVSKVSDCRYLSDCKSRDCEFHPGLVSYFLWDWSWNDFYGHSPPFCWFKKGCWQLQAKVCAQGTSKPLSQTCKSVVRWTSVYGSDLMPCNTIDKPQVVYRFRNVMTFIITLCKRQQKFLTFSSQKCQF